MSAKSKRETQPKTLPVSALAGSSVPSRRKALQTALGLGAGLVLCGASETALAASPEDMLKGMLIISDESFPTKWTSPAEYAARLKKMHKNALAYDKKTKKLQIYYAAFFKDPVPDVQVNFVIYDITDKGAKAKKGAWEAFLGRKGERALFNSIELDQEDVEPNKKYQFAIERRIDRVATIIAKGEITLTAEKPKYDGKVSFSDDEARGKKPIAEPEKK